LPIDKYVLLLYDYRTYKKRFLKVKSIKKYRINDRFLLGSPADIRNPTKPESIPDSRHPRRECICICGAAMTTPQIE